MFKALRYENESQLNALWMDEAGKRMVTNVDVFLKHSVDFHLGPVTILGRDATQSQ
jgi:hypothetical protein